MAAEHSYLLGNKEFYVLAAVRAATDSRGALTPANVHWTFSVRLNRFTHNAAVHIGSLGTALQRGESSVDVNKEASSKAGF